MSVDTQHVWEAWLSPLLKLDRDIAKHKKKESRGSEKRAANRLGQKKRTLAGALERLGKDCPKLCHGEPDIELSSAQVEKLIADVCAGAGGYELRQIQRYLVKGLGKGVIERRWLIPVPAPMAIGGVESSNVTPQNFRLLDGYDDLEDAFYRQLETESDTQRFDMERDAGQLIFSMCFHAGVCSRYWLQAVPEAVRLGAGVHDGFVWLELGKENNLEKSDYKDRRRRLFLAPVTQILLWRWHKRWGNTWPRDAQTLNYLPVDYLLRRFAKELISATELSATLAGKCLSLSEANLATRLPNTLLQYMRSNRVGVPLTEQNWLRLLTDRRAITSGPTAVTEKTQRVKAERLRTRVTFPNQKKLFIELCHGIQGQTNAAGRKFIDNFLHRKEVSPILQLMASWAAHLLEHGGVVKRRLADSSVIRYLNWIKALLFYADDLQDPLNLDEDSWQAIYDEIIGNAHGMISDCAGRLAAFHWYLVQAYGIPPVDVAGISADRQVDSRILSLREYQRVRELLQSRATDEEIAECQEIILIFGYRLGLRRGEAFSRLFADFSGIDVSAVEEAELLVRPNKNARIKSESSTRRLPLGLLLTKEELAKLRQFYERRLNFIPGTTQRKPLFADANGSIWSTIISRLFDPLTRTLQDVTGDSQFRFHHLRHSFVTFTFLRLVERTPGEFIPLAWRQDEKGTDLMPSLEACLWKKSKLPDSGQALWLLAMWTGHASPQVTLECYSHLLDWLVGCYVFKRHNPELSFAAQRGLLGKTAEALERYRNRKGFSRAPTLASDIAIALSDSWPVAGRRALPMLRNHQPVEYRESTLSRKTRWLDPYRLQLLAVEPVVDGVRKRPRGLDAAAQLMRIPLKKARLWDKKCRALMLVPPDPSLVLHKQSLFLSPKSKLSRATKDVLRPLEEKDLSRRLPELPRRFLAPPNTPDTRRFAEKYFDLLVDWHSKDPENAMLSMICVLESSQRSKSEIRPRGAGRKKLLFDLLRALNLKNQTILTIKVSPEKGRKKVKKYWADFFSVSPDKINCEPGKLPEKLGVHGRCHITVYPPPALKKKQNLFWSTLRFALFSAYIVCAQEEGDDDNG